MKRTTAALLALSCGLLGVSAGLGSARADAAEDVVCKGFDARKLQEAADFLKDQIRSGRDQVDVVPVGEFTLVCVH